jgi:hypothetical protein
MRKKTAVEWLIDEIRNHMAFDTLNAVAISELKLRAKLVERDQILDAYKAAVNAEYNDEAWNSQWTNVDAIDYYHTTYR